ncbi:MAG: hypothetical protein RL077_977 [Verrucomicrobiota bacterium]|jgi:hypothetical protein
MKTSTLVRTLVVALASAVRLSAQMTLLPPNTPVGPLTTPRLDQPIVMPPPSGSVTIVTRTNAGRTTISLEMEIERVVFFASSRVTLPLGDAFKVTVPTAAGLAVHWTKGGRVIPGATSHVLVVDNVSAADADFYTLSLTGPVEANRNSQTLEIGVGPTDRLVNLSTRGILSAGAGQSVTTGFVIGTSVNRGKQLIFRVIGPTLATFGVAAPLRSPVLRIFDSAGAIQSYTAIRNVLISDGRNPDAELAEALTRVGAFPLPKNTLDIALMMPLVPGAYTAQVTSADNTGGEVLIEIYEVP